MIILQQLNVLLGMASHTPFTLVRHNGMCKGVEEYSYVLL